MKNSKAIFGFLAVISLGCTIQYSVAQSAKEYYKSGVKFKEELRCTDAIANFSRAIEADTSLFDAYINRAFCYDEQKKYAEAVADYLKALKLKPGRTELYAKAGEDYLKLEKYKEALEAFLKIKSEEVMPQIIFSKLKLHDYDSALFDCNAAIEENKSKHILHFYKGWACDSTENHTLVAVSSYQKAVDLLYSETEYRRTNKINPVYMEYFQKLANAQTKISRLPEAFVNYNTAVLLDPANATLYCQRGTAYALNANFPEAMNDFNKSIAIDNMQANTFYQRGLVYMKIEQFQNAVNDFNKAIAMSENNPAYYQSRGEALVGTTKFKEAIKDYQAAIALKGDKKYIDVLINDTEKKLFEKNRESNSPDITFNPSVYDGRFMKIPFDAKLMYELIGKIKDESKIETIKVDGQDAVFEPEQLNPEFSSVINNVQNKQQITVEVTDVYGNTNKETYNVIRVESDAPLVTLTKPEIGADKNIYPDDTLTYKLYVEGKVADESKISTIVINGKFASFSQTELNPVFSANIDIANIDSVKIIITDTYGNEAVNTYPINWKGVSEEQSNPMGRTWVVFVENANYENFLSLDGPTNDVSLMKAALANYRIDKVITKRDMTKERIERYFSIELRDEVKKNRVTTLIIWYAGHGILHKDNGYWIPVDAKKDDEYTYFLISNLKGYLTTYSNMIHLLVISDACETGPAFYLAMRESDKPKHCGDWELTKFKSAQVLASTNTEKASDNSVLAKTFANALKSNPDNCIALDAIANKVITAIKLNQKQNPVFGNINGLENQDGSFFFIRH